MKSTGSRSSNRLQSVGLKIGHRCGGDIKDGSVAYPIFTRNVTGYQIKQYVNLVCLLFRDGISLQRRHNGSDRVSNHQPHYCLLNRLFGRRSKKHHSSASLAFVRGIHRSPVNSPHKGQWLGDVSIWWRHHVASLIGRYNMTSTEWKERKKIKVVRRYFIKWKVFFLDQL